MPVNHFPVIGNGPCVISAEPSDRWFHMLCNYADVICGNDTAHAWFRPGFLSFFRYQVFFRVPKHQVFRRCFRAGRKQCFQLTAPVGKPVQVNIMALFRQNFQVCQPVIACQREQLFIAVFEQPVPVEKEQADDNPELVDTLMKIILSIRQDARAAKNWAVADKIRDELKTAGIVVEDTPQGAVWKKA